MSTLSEVAREAADSFESFTREGSETTLYRRKDDAAEWIDDLCHAAHGDGNLLPDDWRYECILDALHFIADNADGTPSDELEHDFCDSAVDVYNAGRTEWLASHLSRAGYVDEAREEGLIGPDADTFQQIGVGQYLEAREVFTSVWSSLEDREAELDEEADDDE